VLKEPRLLPPWSERATMCTCTTSKAPALEGPTSAPRYCQPCQQGGMPGAPATAGTLDEYVAPLPTPLGCACMTPSCTAAPSCPSAPHLRGLAYGATTAASCTHATCLPVSCLPVSQVPATRWPPAVTAMHVGSQDLAKTGSMQGHCVALWSCVAEPCPPLMSGLHV
jgi:hypothetical protein